MEIMPIYAAGCKLITYLVALGMITKWLYITKCKMILIPCCHQASERFSSHELTQNIRLENGYKSTSIIGSRLIKKTHYITKTIAVFFRPAKVLYKLHLQSGKYKMTQKAFFMHFIMSKVSLNVYYCTRYTFHTHDKIS